MHVPTARGVRSTGGAETLRKSSFSGCRRLTDAMAGRRSVSPEMRSAVSYASSAAPSIRATADVDVGLLLLVTGPTSAAVLAAPSLFLKPAVDPPDLLAIACERVEVSCLPPLSVRIVTHAGREILNLAQLLVRPQQALYQRLEVQPEVLSTILGLQSEVEVEPVDVGNHAVHRASAFAWGERYGTVGTYPVGVSSPDPTASLRRGRLFSCDLDCLVDHALSSLHQPGVSNPGQTAPPRWGRLFCGSLGNIHPGVSSLG